MLLIFMWSNQNIYSWPSIIYYTCFSILLRATWFICLHELLFLLIIHNWSFFDVCVQFNQTSCLRFLLRLSVSEPLLINATSNFYFWVLLLYSTISLFCLMVVDTFFFNHIMFVVLSKNYLEMDIHMNSLYINTHHFILLCDILFFFVLSSLN